jgi:hypothetical protein
MHAMHQVAKFSARAVTLRAMDLKDSVLQPWLLALKDLEMPRKHFKIKVTECTLRIIDICCYYIPEFTQQSEVHQKRRQEKAANDADFQVLVLFCSHKHRPYI